MENLRQCVSALLLGACFVVPIISIADDGSPKDADGKPGATQKRQAEDAQDKPRPEKAITPAQPASPGTDMPIIIQEQPVKPGIVKMI